MRHTHSFAPILALGLVISPGLVHRATAQTDLAKDSPFMTANGTAAATPAESLEFAGVSSVGKKTDLIIHDKSTKKSRWIPIGETIDGITALKYDARLEQAVVRANGVEKTLALRKGSGPVNAPSAIPPALVPLPVPAPLPVATQPANSLPLPLGLPPAAAVVAPATGPQTPEMIAKQETEARMLVSDLLEIGMAQRKAYEEAQRKAAAGETGAPPVAPPPPTPAAAGPNDPPPPAAK